MPPSRRHRLAATTRWCLAGAIAVVLSCGEAGVIKTPLVRVDLTDRWPRKARRLAIAAIELECHRIIALPAGGAAPRLRVDWRVFDFGKSRYIAAVEVRPDGDGSVPGMRSVSGSAWVGNLENRGTAEAVLAAVPVNVGWTGQRGCSAVSRSESALLRADDPSCAAPKLPKLLRPVK